MRKRNLIKLFVILLTLTSCSLTIPNIEICRDRGLEGHCVKTITEEERIIPEHEWPDFRYNTFHIEDKSWGELKKFMLKACSLKNVKCKKETLLLQIQRIESLLEYEAG